MSTPLHQLPSASNTDQAGLSQPRTQVWFQGAIHYLQQEPLRILLLIILAVIVRVPGLQGDRIWDDNYLAFGNPFIKSPILIPEAFRHYLFLDSASSHYRPVQNITFIIDYFFWNTNAWGFHLTNVLLHAASGILLYLLLRQLLPTFVARRDQTTARKTDWASWSALLIAMIWVVHPVHSAAIDYISGRADSLAFLFSAGGWLIFRAAQTTGHPLARSSIYLLTATCALLALCSREIALIWMALFIGHLLFVEKKSVPSRIWTVAGCLIVVSAYVFLRHLPEQRPVATGESWNAPLRAILMARSLGDYARLMIFPGNLHMERTVMDYRLYADNAGWRSLIEVEYLSIIGLITLATLIFACIKNGRGRQLRIFGAIWFIAAWLPISNIIQLNATAAEHWLYLPSVGFLIFLAGCLIELPSRHRRFIPALAIIAIVALGVRSFTRSTDWSDEETFYTRTLQSGSHSARVACNLGQLYVKRKEFARAERIFLAVVRENPDYPIAQNNLADLYFHQGKKIEAEKLFAEIEKNAVKTRDEYSRTWIGALNYAIMRHNNGDDEDAITVLEKARADYPNVWELIALESELLRKLHRIDDALQIVETFARDNWWHYGANYALGQLYVQNGELECGESYFRQASRLDIHDAEALRALALLRLHENRFDEAFQIQQQAIARQPDEPRQYILLSDILGKMGRETEAQAVLAKVSRMRQVVNDSIEDKLTPAL